MIITVRRLGPQPCWSEPWTGFSARTVFPTLEVIIREAPAELRKVMNSDIGIALIDLDQSES